MIWLSLGKNTTGVEKMKTKFNLEIITIIGQLLKTFN